MSMLGEDDSGVAPYEASPSYSELTGGGRRRKVRKSRKSRKTRKSLKSRKAARRNGLKSRRR
jgi:hypothetical protein